MRELLNMGGKLLLFTLIAGILLAGTNLLTEGPIAEHQLQSAQSAQRAVLAQAQIFTEMDLSDQAQDPAAYNTLTGLYAGRDGEQTVGYVLTASPMGYGGPIPITLGISAEGWIAGIAIGELSETSGVGTRVAEEPFLSQYTALAADPAAVDEAVDTLSGATVSSSAVKRATEQMAAYSRDVLGIEPQPGQAPLSEEDVARQRQLPEAKAFERVDPYLLLGSYDTIREVYAGVSGTDTVGYTFELAPQGYVDVIELRLSIDPGGTITALEVLSNHESEEYGQRISREPWFIDSFIGKPAQTEAIDGIDALSGATGTSDAVKGSVKQAIDFYLRYLLGQDLPQADPDAVSQATWEEETPTDPPDAVSEATWEEEEPSQTPDAVSEATWEEETPSPTPDAVSEATWEQETPAPTPEADAVSEASYETP